MTAPSLLSPDQDGAGGDDRADRLIHGIVAGHCRIAVAGGGEYFEIGEESDRTIAFRIVDRLRRRALNAKPVETFEDLYGRFLLAAAIVLCAGVLVVRKRTELAWQTAGALAVVLLLASVM